MTAIDKAIAELSEKRAEILEQFCKEFLASLPVEELTPELFNKIELRESVSFVGQTVINTTWAIGYKERTK